MTARIRKFSRISARERRPRLVLPRAHQADADGVDEDVVGRELLGQRLGEGERGP